MKQILFTVAIATLFCGGASAQVTKTTFNNNIAVLSKAIDDKALASQNATIKVLIGLMDNQIAYLRSSNNTKGRNPTVDADTQIDDYVKNLSTSRIVIDKQQLIMKLNQFATTCQ